MLQYQERRGYTKMRSFKYIKSAVLVLLCAAALTTSNICTDGVIAAAPAAVKPAVQESAAAPENTITVKPLDVVNSPKVYLNKTLKMNAKFDKFSTLGLDYKPAYKSSEDYISFLIKRDDTSYDIPLSEMKLFLKRDEAEKFIDLKTDDEISITGVMFSDALGDVWIDVKNLSVVKKAPEKKDGVSQ